MNIPFKLAPIFRSARRFTTSIVHSKEQTVFHNSLDHATGIEKRELLAHLAGECDPFRMMMIKRGPGTCECPNMIPSAFKMRIVGCVCEEGAMHVNFMWLHENVPKRCECGFWFVLCPVAPFC